MTYFASASRARVFTTCRPRMARIGLLHRIRRECVNNSGVKSLHRVVLDRSARTRFDCLPGEAGTFIRFPTDGCAIHWMRTREVVSRLERRDVRKRPRETANRPLRLGIAFFGGHAPIGCAPRRHPNCPRSRSGNNRKACLCRVEPRRLASASQNNELRFSAFIWLMTKP